MLKKILCNLLIVFPLITHAGTFKFCVNNNNYSYPQFTVDSKLYYYNYTHSTYCWDVIPIGNRFVVLFTNGFDLNYNGSLCGNADPCTIPLMQSGSLATLTAFVSVENNKVSGTLSAEYKV
jgi:hypothetical protein